ncbi:hypothetical protein FIBSPDRAFT_932816 [Athelia psychrophila]|uniref:Mid2 domain-containing protein n=1 Tax=Athelia psychrophila TaxID=1759441 RepID=A0A166I402_9AGAM|nr:hypothetical protein FIBSPDRAFT_932816 [Fibularhizoctonia sp. CBS 109695]
MSSWTILALALGFLLAVEPAQSQSTINCLSDYKWMDNSLGQNPCLMANLAWGACGDPTVPADDYLDPLASTPAAAAGFYYPGPTKDEVGTCICNTITYSFFSACSICQNGTSNTWVDYVKNCKNVSIGISTYPLPVPDNTAFPAWAYLNVTGGFNAAAAQAAIAGPESTPIPTSTSASSSTSTITATGTGSSSSPSTSAAGNQSLTSHKSSNTGAIAGGVIGGLAFVAALAGLAVYLLRRRAQSHTAPSDSYYGAVPQKSLPSMSENSYAQQQQPLARPYDPSDPSTFPESLPTPTIQTTSSGFAAHEQPGAYRGVAEV